MARLPTPGSDNGNWGDILNDFLSVELNTDGSLKKTSDIAAKYEKPSSGIPAGDLSSVLQTSIVKADTSVQSVNAVFPDNGNVTLAASDVGAIPAIEKGAADGVASLDGVGKIVETQIPGGVTRKVTRRSMAVLSTPGLSQYSNAAMAFRVPVMISSATTRWRLRIRNIDVFSNTPISSGANFEAVYIGDQAFDTSGAQTGGFTASPVQALPGFVLPGDGSEYVSDWITDDLMQLDASTPHLISLAYTGGGTQRYGVGRMWFSTQANLVSQQAATGFNSIDSCIFDIRIEYETETSGSVIAAIGDSTTQGAGSSTHPICTYQRWPERWALRTGNHTVNGGISSATFSVWDNGTEWCFQRLNPTEITYDAVITDLGINGISSGMAAFQVNHVTHVATLRSVFGSNVRIFANGVKPYDTHNHGVITSYLYAGSTTFLLSFAFGSGAVIRVGTGRTAELKTVSGSPTGSGPYLHTVSTAFINDHAINEVVSGANEQARQDVNAYLSSLPSGIDGFFPTHLAVQAAWDEAKWNPHLSVDPIHPSVAGHAVIAASIPDIR